ncbi:Rhomboid-like protein 19 [Orobanche gracilis]
MSTPPLSGGTSLFSGITKLCKGLAVVLISGHIVVQLFPSAVTYLAVIPASVVVSTFGLLFIGKLLQPIWGSREFLKFIFVVNFLTSVCLFITAIALYYITRQEIYLILHATFWISGVISGFLVGIKQIIPDQELPLLKIKTKWLPSIAILLCIAISFWTLEAAAYLPTIISGTYISWIYLRYWQTKPETKLRGDPSEDFAFSTFFPEFLRPVIDPIASIFHRMLCGRSDASNDAQGYALGGEPLPERGARALEERLAAERLAAARSELQRDASENV